MEDHENNNDIEVKENSRSEPNPEPAFGDTNMADARRILTPWLRKPAQQDRQQIGPNTFLVTRYLRRPLNDFEKMELLDLEEQEWLKIITPYLARMRDANVELAADMVEYWIKAREEYLTKFYGFPNIKFLNADVDDDDEPFDISRETHLEDMRFAHGMDFRNPDCWFDNIENAIRIAYPEDWKYYTTTPAKEASPASPSTSTAPTPAALLSTATASPPVFFSPAIAAIAAGASTAVTEPPAMTTVPEIVAPPAAASSQTTVAIASPQPPPPPPTYHTPFLTHRNHLRTQHLALFTKRTDTQTSLDAATTSATASITRVTSAEAKVEELEAMLAAAKAEVVAARQAQKGEDGRIRSAEGEFLDVDKEFGEKGKEAVEAEKDVAMVMRWRLMMTEL